MTTIYRTAAVQTRRRRRAMAVGAAVLATVVLWVLARVLGTELEVDLRNGEAPMTIGLPIAVAFSLQFALAGWVLLALLERFTGHAWRAWVTAASAVLLLSFVPVLGVEASAGTRIVLALMHLAVAVALIAGLRPAATGTEERA